MADPIIGTPVNPDDGSFFAAPGAMAPAGASDFVSAGLHPTESLGAFGGWKCPRCLQENTGRFELGCAFCPAGRPGQQGQQAPPLRGLPEVAEGPARRDGIDQPIERLPTDPPVSPRTDATIAEAVAAFEAWLDQRLALTPADRHGELRRLDGLLRDCWIAAWFDGYTRVRGWQPAAVLADPARVDGGAAPLDAGFLDVAKPALRRTLIAALNHFVDTVLAESPDEIASGLWLSRDETQQLIQRLEGVE